MNSITLNISLPQAMHIDAKRMVKAQKYTSISELIRDAMRKIMYRNITENGFTRQFEEQILKAEADPIENSIKWNGRGSFVDFVLNEGAKKYAKSNISRNLLPRIAKNSNKTARFKG